MAHVQDQPEPPSKRNPSRKVPEGIEALVLRSLAKRPSDRVPSAGQFRDSMEAWAKKTGLWQTEDQQHITANQYALVPGERNAQPAFKLLGQQLLARFWK